MNLQSYIRDVPDFPKEGILFRDMSPLLADVPARNALVDQFVSIIDVTKPTVICGLDARGFIIASLVAQKYQLPFVMIRKSGKLPGKTIQKEYTLEYGSDVFEIQEGALNPDDRVLIVDDVLATGGTLSAAIQLIQSSEAYVCGISCVIELGDLGGRERLSGIDFYPLIQY